METSQYRYETRDQIRMFLLLSFTICWVIGTSLRLTWTSVCPQVCIRSLWKWLKNVPVRRRWTHLAPIRIVTGQSGGPRSPGGPGGPGRQSRRPGRRRSRKRRTWTRRWPSICRVPQSSSSSSKRRRGGRRGRRRGRKKRGAGVRYGTPRLHSSRVAARQMNTAEAETASHRRFMWHFLVGADRLLRPVSLQSPADFALSVAMVTRWPFRTKTLHNLDIYVRFHLLC